MPHQFSIPQLYLSMLPKSSFQQSNIFHPQLFSFLISWHHPPHYLFESLFNSAFEDTFLLTLTASRFYLFFIFDRSFCVHETNLIDLCHQGNYLRRDLEQFRSWPLFGCGAEAPQALSMQFRCSGCSLPRNLLQLQVGFKSGYLADWLGRWLVGW
jgi:hypothetical protein